MMVNRYCLGRIDILPALYSLGLLGLLATGCAVNRSPSPPVQPSRVTEPAPFQQRQPVRENTYREGRQEQSPGKRLILRRDSPASLDQKNLSRRKAPQRPAAQPSRKASPARQSGEESPSATSTAGSITFSRNDPPAVVPPEELKARVQALKWRDEGVDAYRNARYEDALEKLDRSAASGMLTLKETAEALGYGAAAAYWLGREGLAADRLRRLFRLETYGELDPAVFPPAFVAFARETQRDMDDGDGSSEGR